MHSCYIMLFMLHSEWQYYFNFIFIITVCLSQTATQALITLGETYTVSHCIIKHILYVGKTFIYTLLHISTWHDQIMKTMWSTGRHQQSWTGDLTGAPGGSRRRYISERRDSVQWTRMRAAIHWITHTTDFLPCHITTVTRTGRRTEQASSDEDLW